jgi:hypothetical protein
MVKLALKPAPLAPVQPRSHRKEGECQNQNRDREDAKDYRGRDPN